MNEQAIRKTGEHDEIALLLPWYANHSLPDDERQRVERHLTSCLICHHELKSIEQLKMSFDEGDSPNTVAHVSFRNLQKKLGAKPSPTASRHTNPTEAGTNRRHRLFRREAFGWAMAAGVLLTIGPSLLKQAESWFPNQYATLSSASPSVSAQMEVVFSPEVMAKHRDELIESVGGELVGNPNSLGAYRIRLRSPSSKIDPATAAAMLRRQPGVLLAEPLVASKAGQTP